MDQAALFPYIMAVVDDIVNQCDAIEAERQRELSRTGGESVLTTKK